MTRRSRKEIITEAVLTSLPNRSSYQNLTTEQIAFKWFATGRTGSGLRLTEEGFKCFTESDITFYEFPVDYSLKSIFIKPDTFAMSLNKHIGPEVYYEVYLRVYESKIAMMISLYGGVEEYLNSFTSS
jgi:hypothetical protein